MVQISTFLVTAIAAGTVFAAPIIEIKDPISSLGLRAHSGAREQLDERTLASEDFLEARGKFTALKSVAQIAGKVVNGVGLAATIGSIVLPQAQSPHRRSFERREPAKFAISPSTISSTFQHLQTVGKALAGGVALGSAVAPIFKPKDKQKRLYGQEAQIEARRLSGGAVGRIVATVAGAAGFGGSIAALNTINQRRDRIGDFNEFSGPLARDWNELVDVDNREHHHHELEGRETSIDDLD